MLFPLHHSSSFLRCFLSLLIVVTPTNGGIKHAHAESSVLFQFTLSSVMKYMVVPHRPLWYFVVTLKLSYFFPSLLHAVLSLFSLPALELFLLSHWFLVDCFLTAINCKKWSVVGLVNLAVFFSPFMDESHFSSFTCFTVASYCCCWDKLHCLRQVLSGNMLQQLLRILKNSCERTYFPLAKMKTHWINIVCFVCLLHYCQPVKQGRTWLCWKDVQ